MSGVRGPTVTPFRRTAKPSWLLACQTNKSADPLANLYNAHLALSEDPEWADALGFDEMLQAAVLRASGLPITDTDISAIQHWMQDHGLEHMGVEAVRQAVDLRARANAFHPLRERLVALAANYDGVPRLADWLINYLGGAADEYHRAVGTMFLVGMVARVFSPGCKADYMLVLEGPQKQLKSSACEALAGEYFSDTLPDLARDPVRVSMHLRGKWLVEVSELSSFGRVAAAHLKAFLTTKVEQYTPKFGRFEVREPRSCLFVGTTNKHAYLLDETGGRRFWPVKCGSIDLEGLKRDRNQLLAEAVDAFHRGTQWWPDPAFEENFIAPVQASRYGGDAWETAIADWDFAIPDDQGLGTRVPLSKPFFLANIALGALRIEDGKLNKRDEQRLVTVLEYLGWLRAKRTNRGVPWFPPP